MPAVEYNGLVFPMLENETILDTLLRNGVAAPHSCRSGACQTCLMQAKHGAPPQQAQRGLKDTLKAQGYFLSCQWAPNDDVVIGDSQCEVEATTVGKRLLNESVVELRLMPKEPFEYAAGQYLQLMRNDGLARSYSLASLPTDSEPLTLHVQRMEGGAMSGWIHDALQEGDAVSIRGPVGECFYTCDNPDRPLLLAGTGTGLAPLYGIARDALQQGHQGPIHLFHGSLHAKGLYLMDELREMAERHPQFFYYPYALHGDAASGVPEGDLTQEVKALVKSFAGWRIYLCGAPALVNALRKTLFLAGASMQDIFADPFLTTADSAVSQA